MRMQNEKKNVHDTGALGFLLSSGQIAKISDESSTSHVVSKYMTNAGIGFTEDEFLYVDPQECEPWEYANRSLDDFGDIEELKNSIKNQKQLQPVLIRDHVNPHHNVKYEIIFGRRRHYVCKELGVKMMVIKKQSLSLQEALKLQHIENEHRKNVSNYSNAVMYKKLLSNKVYKSETALSEALGIPRQTISGCLYYAKIDNEIVSRMGANIHIISKDLARKIVTLCEEDENNRNIIIQKAHELGMKIKTPIALLSEISKNNKTKLGISYDKVALLTDKNGKKILEIKRNFRGKLKFDIANSAVREENYENFCEHLKMFFQEAKLVYEEV